MANYNAYTEDLQRYLVSKFPNDDVHTIMEVCEYIGNRTARLMFEVIDERDKEWKRATRQKSYAFRQKKETMEDKNDGNICEKTT